MPEESLKNKTVKGVGWSAVDNATFQNTISESNCKKSVI